MRTRAVLLVIALAGPSLGCGDTRERAAALEARVEALELAAAESAQVPMDRAVMFSFERALCDRLFELAVAEGSVTAKRAEAIRDVHWLECLVDLSSTAMGLDAARRERLHACAEGAATRREIMGCYASVRYLAPKDLDAFTQALECGKRAQSYAEVEACRDGGTP